jgi:hypothetical protein
MNLEEAQQLRQRLLYLEGLIAWKSREYIWKILIGPLDRRQLGDFRDSIDPFTPFDPRALLKPYLLEELSVYFFLKNKGCIICREYDEFLSANNMVSAGKGYRPMSYLNR